MYIKNDIIYFKSDEPYYIKEKSGLKKNTVRFISDEEHDIILDTIDNLKYISISNKFNAKFIRTLTDITIPQYSISQLFKENLILYIFSWE